MDKKYVISFLLKEPVEIDVLQNDIYKYLDSKKIKKIVRLDNNDIQITSFKDNNYNLHFETNKNFGYILKLDTDSKADYQSLMKGFFLNIFDLLFNHLKVNVNDAEFFSEYNFNIANERFEQRYISRRTMCAFLESKQKKKVPIKISGKVINNIEITKGIIPNDGNVTFEEAWFAISENMEYDDWDMTTSEFLPLFYDEYIQDINEFSKNWNIPISEFISIDQSKINSIIRIEKSPKAVEYLFQFTDDFQFMNVEVIS